MDDAKKEFINHLSVLESDLKDLFYDFSDETANLINEIHFSDTYSQTEWNKLYEKCKNNVYAIYAISTQNTIPKNIIEAIVHNDTLYSNTTSKFSANLYYQIFLNLLSQKEISHEQVRHICQQQSVGLYETLDQLTYEGYQNQIKPSRDFPHPNNFCKIPPNVAFIMNDEYMNSTMSEKFKFNWRHMPLRFIHNNTKALEELSKVEDGFYNNAQAEQICAAIANNANLAFEIREKAMENTNIDDIYFATETMKRNIYLILVDSYYSAEMNPVKNKGKELTEEEKKSHLQAKIALINKIKQGFFTNTELIDMVYRAQNIHNGEYEDKVLKTLFECAEDPNILKLADMLDKRPCVEIAYMNPKMDDKFKEKYVSDITSTIPIGTKRDKMNFSTMRRNALIKITKTTELEKESKYKPTYRKLLQRYIPNECATSAYTPTDIIQEIVSDCENKFDKMYKNIERHNIIDTIDKKSYLYGQLNLLMRDANFQKEEINNMLMLLENLCISNKMDWYYKESGGHTFTPIVKDNTKYLFINDHINIAKVLFHLPEKKRELFKEILNKQIDKYHKKQPQHILLSAAKQTIEHCENLSRAYFYYDFSKCDYKTIDMFKNVFEKDFIKNIKENALKSINNNKVFAFYENFNDVLKSIELCNNALKEIREHSVKIQEENLNI